MTRLLILPNDQLQLQLESPLPAAGLAQSINSGSLPEIILHNYPGPVPPLRAVCVGSQVVVFPRDPLEAAPAAPPAPAQRAPAGRAARHGGGPHHQPDRGAPGDQPAHRGTPHGHPAQAPGPGQPPAVGGARHHPRPHLPRPPTPHPNVGAHPRVRPIPTIVRPHSRVRRPRRPDSLRARRT